MAVTSGPSVRILTPEDAFELYSLRAMLEGLTIRLAIARASVAERTAIAAILEAMAAAVTDNAVSLPAQLARSAEIHEGIVRLSKYERLIAVYRSLALQIALLNRVVGPTSTKEHEVAWHRPVVEALLSDIPEAAERVIRTHIHESYDAYMAASGAGQAADAWF